MTTTKEVKKMSIASSGSVYLYSETDKRWNVSLYVDYLSISAGMHPMLIDAFEQRKALYGDPPADLEWGGMKD